MTLKGTCKLCGKAANLTYEHIPPRQAGNKGGFISIPHEQFSENPFLVNIKGKKQQGGVGFYALCKECNSFTGRMFGNSYIDFVNQANYRYLYSDFRYTQGDPFIIHPLKIIKQIISYFICISPGSYIEMYPELNEFVLNKQSNSLPDKYQFYSYYNFTPNNYRYISDNVLYQDGFIYKISEVAFPPFGFVMIIDEPRVKFDNRLVRITGFKNYPYYRRDIWMNIKLNILPVSLIGIPGDYRTKHEIDAAIKHSNETYNSQPLQLQR